MRLIGDLYRTAGAPAEACGSTRVAQPAHG
jgi:hypothetical protein